jgi:hypothetical protein
MEARICVNRNNCLAGELLNGRWKQDREAKPPRYRSVHHDPSVLVGLGHQNLVLVQAETIIDLFENIERCSALF